MIALDFDNVLADTMGSWIKHFHPTLTLEDITRYNFWTLPKINITKEEAYSIFHTVWNNYKFLQPTYNKKDLRETLYRLQGKAEIVTACERKIVDKWLEFWELPVLPITYSPDKLNPRFNILVDDKPLDLLMFNESNGISIVFDRPWNREVKDLKRIYSLKEINP